MRVGREGEREERMEAMQVFRLVRAMHSKLKAGRHTSTYMGSLEA